MNPSRFARVLAALIPECLGREHAAYRRARGGRWTRVPFNTFEGIYLRWAPASECPRHWRPFDYGGCFGTYCSCEVYS